MKDLLAIPVPLTPREGRPPHREQAPTPSVSSSKGKSSLKLLQQSMSPRRYFPMRQQSPDPWHQSQEPHRERLGSHLRSLNTWHQSLEQWHRSPERQGSLDLWHCALDSQHGSPESQTRSPSPYKKPNGESQLRDTQHPGSWQYSPEHRCAQYSIVGQSVSALLWSPMNSSSSSEEEEVDPTNRAVLM